MLAVSKFVQTTVAIAAAATVAVLPGCATEPAPSEATVARDDLVVEAVSDAALRMYTLIAQGNYAEAYAVRSQNCKAAVTESDYTAGVRSIYEFRDLLAVPPSVIVETHDPYHARVQVLFHDLPSALLDDKRPREWINEDGGWKFDNCS